MVGTTAGVGLNTFPPMKSTDRGPPPGIDSGFLGVGFRGRPGGPGIPTCCLIYSLNLRLAHPPPLRRNVSSICWPTAQHSGPRASALGTKLPGQNRCQTEGTSRWSLDFGRVRRGRFSTGFRPNLAPRPVQIGGILLTEPAAPKMGPVDHI